jgi:hypothetical protein
VGQDAASKRHHCSNTNVGGNSTLDNLDYLKVILFIGQISALTSCKKENPLLDKKYEGFWMETGCTYEFRDNGQSIFKSEGHYGDMIDSGFYFRHDSLSYLIQKQDDKNLIAGTPLRGNINASFCYPKGRERL